MNGDMCGAYPNNFFRKQNDRPNPHQFNADPRSWSHPNYANPEDGVNSGHFPHNACGGGFDSPHFNNGWSPGRGAWNGRMNGNYARGPRGNRHMGQMSRGNQRFNGPGRNKPSGGDHFCDSCDRGFPSAEDLQHHCQNDHVVCGLDGCTLSAHPKVMEKHQKMQHASGLFTRIASVFSESPEVVKKWIADRKRNYPTKENIERRKQEDQQCLDRGESLGLRRGGGSRFGRSRGMNRNRGRGRGGFGRGNHHESRGRNNELHKKKWNRKNNRNGRQKRDHGVKAPQEKMSEDEECPIGIPMFTGTAQMFGIALEKCPSSDEEIEDGGDFSDMEWTEEKEGINASAEGEAINESVSKEEAPKNNGITLSNALGVLMGSYASDGSDEESPPVVVKTPVERRGSPANNKSSSKQEKVDCNMEPAMDKSSSSQGNGAPEREPEVACKRKDDVESDGSAPEEISIVKRPKIEEEEEGVRGDRGEKGEEGNNGNEGGTKRIRRSRKRGRGKGSVENRSDVSADQKSDAGNVRQKPEVANMPQEMRYPTLLEELLKNEIRHERNVILQCIRYIVQNNFFDPKEVAPVVDPKRNEEIEDPMITQPQNSSSEACEKVNSECESNDKEQCSNSTMPLENEPQKSSSNMDEKVNNEHESDSHEQCHNSTMNLDNDTQSASSDVADNANDKCVSHNSEDCRNSTMNLENESQNPSSEGDEKANNEHESKNPEQCSNSTMTLENQPQNPSSEVDGNVNNEQEINDLQHCSKSEMATGNSA